MDNAKYTIALSRREIQHIAWILDHFSDYVGGDDRLDHGWNRLKEWRNLPADEKRSLYGLSAKFIRKSRKLQENAHKDGNLK